MRAIIRAILAFFRKLLGINNKKETTSKKIETEKVEESIDNNEEIDANNSMNQQPDFAKLFGMNFNQDGSEEDSSSPDDDVIGSYSNEDMHRSEPDKDFVSKVDEPIVFAPIQKKIGIKGGSLEDKNLSVNIPEGALSNETNIVAQYVKEPKQLSKQITSNFVGGIEFGPSGTTFDKPVEVSINVDSKGEKELSVFCLDEESDTWYFIGTAPVNNGKATFSVDHFSKYGCLNVTQEMLDKYIKLVYYALEHNKSDSWITAQYKKYLIDEEHVLDYYTEYGGVYYYACGLHINGMYAVRGKEGNPNQLIELVGEMNMIGNKMGLATVAGEHFDWMKHIKSKEKNENLQDIININISIEYKMIKPKIEVTALPVSVGPGEKSIVSVHTHYPNPNNKLFPDFDLPNYHLTLPWKLKHFSVESDEIITGIDGRTTFEATALDKGKDCIKVQFFVDDLFGEYADGYVEVRCGSDYVISGHIEETREGNYECGKNATDAGFPMAKMGKFKFKVSYDFEGEIFKVDQENINGELEFKNVAIKFECNDVFYKMAQGANGELKYWIFDHVDKLETPMAIYPFTGVIRKDGTCSISTDKVTEFLITSYMEAKMYTFMSGFGISRKNDGLIPYIIKVSNSKNLLLDFDISDGTKAYSIDYFKDTYNPGMPEPDGRGKTYWKPLSDFFVESSVVGGTTQEITVVDCSIVENKE